MKRINDAVRRILRVKFRAGLFDHPYVDQAKAVDRRRFVTPPTAPRRATAAGQVDGAAEERRRHRCRSTRPRPTAVIGPLGNNQHDMLGPWWGKGDDADAVSVFDGIKAAEPRATTFTEGCTILDKDPPTNTPADECGSDAGFAAAVAAAKAADQVVLALGESRGQSGEAASRSRHRPARQAAGADRRDQGRPASRSSSCCSTAAR